ncbi:helix-turn-helix domain-containing protein [Moheibacter lacus]|uniref:Helix-turn-helix transcriptional regulator n=1 Tax=Moheibacter lacus TaxID=2745851 RepID=A0A838ZGD9_9FLAO|nr:helix-turn-helix transcriptional regulator [Moheibacter lacus]MBA5628771.1 helix-turn-helix transcriptional regulator [Moheibacter lacus]
MKKDQVPQDDGSLSKKDIHELCYAVDENGNYTTVQSSGWNVKSAALDESMELIQERIDQTKKEIAEGKISSLAYFMEVHRMDISVLASYAGIHRWFVKRHFNPKRFKKLSNKTLKKYADVFEISLEELKNYKPD